MVFREKNFRHIIARSSESNRFVLASVTTAVSIFLILFSKVPLFQVFDVTPHPSLISIAIFYWTLKDPERLSIYFLFLIGLLNDLLLVSPIGLSFILYFILQYFVTAQRTMLLNRGLPAKLAVFSLFMVFLYFIIFLLVWRVHGQFPAVKEVFVPYLVTIACFIPFHQLIELVESLVSPKDLRG